MRRKHDILAGHPVASVVITYHPGATFPRCLAAIAREFRATTVIDNTPNPAAANEIAAACAKLDVPVVHNGINCGLARALNQAFAELASQGGQWVVVFDQDSTPAEGFSTALVATAMSTEPPPAIVGANWTDEGRPNFTSRHLRSHPRWPFFFARTEADHDLRDATCVITSGSLFSLPAWRELGGFDEKLFLDLVDTDYCLRATRAGYDIRVSALARMRHRRGAKQPVRFLGRTWWPAFMPPPRLRYLFRNRVRLFARHAWRTPHWAFFEVAYSAKILAEILFLENEKTAKLIACLHGLCDGLLGRSGPIVASTEKASGLE